jgi:DNA-binding NarL/FixJ family response regulator
MIETAITDDHTIAIKGIKTILKSDKEIEILQSFNTIPETMEGLCTHIKVLLLDINLPDGNGIMACKDLLKKFPYLKIIALNNFEYSAFVKQIMKNSASGYLLKNTDKAELIAAIKTVLNGNTYLPQSIQNILLNESIGKGNGSCFIPKLTSREKEILTLIIKEITPEEIANAISVSVKTVEAHRSNIIQKLGVKNTAGLVRVPFEKGLV